MEPSFEPLNTVKSIVILGEWLVGIGWIGSYKRLWYLVGG